ncbi:MAG: hypothetical protein ACLRZH_02260 [Ruthenibacterium lactatiformans]
MKKLLQKTTAVLVSAALAVTCALPAFAEQPTEGVTKDENVFLILNPDGSVSEQIVSDWLHSDTGFDAAADRSTLSGITNLKSDVLPAQDGENLTWTTEDNDIYYQGTTTQTPPVTVDITIRWTAVHHRRCAGGQKRTPCDALGSDQQRGTGNGDAGSRRKVYTPFSLWPRPRCPRALYQHCRTARHRADGRKNAARLLSRHAGHGRDLRRSAAGSAVRS